MNHASLAMLALTSTLLAQSVVVPAASENVATAGGLNTILRNSNAPRTYQYGVNAAGLTNLPIGNVITGVSVRFTTGSNSPTWPPADITWSDYDIWVGPANPTAGWVGDPFLNFSLPPLQVRSGPLTLDAGTYVNTAVLVPPNPWGEFYFDFQTPFQYLGGDLAVLFSHPGSNDLAVAQFPETVASNALTHGVGRSQAINPPGVATVATTFYVMRIHYGFDFGCIGSNGTAPTLVQNRNLTGGLGGNVRFTIVNAPPTALVAFILGNLQFSLPLNVNCNLFTDPALLFLDVTNLKGRAVLNVPVAPGVIGGMFAQGLVFDTLALDGFTMTNGVSPTAN